MPTVPPRRSFVPFVAAFVGIALLAAAPASAIRVAFEADPEGDTFVTRDYGNYRFTTVASNPAQVDPGASICSTGLCPSNGTHTLVVFDSLQISSIDGTPFQLRSIDIGAPLQVGGNLRLFVTPADGSPSRFADDPPPVPEGTFQEIMLPYDDFGHLLSVTILFGGAFQGVDNVTLVATPPLGTPPPADIPITGMPDSLTLLAEQRFVEADWTSCYYDSDPEYPGLVCSPTVYESAAPSAPFAPFDAYVSPGGASASQESTISTAGFQGRVGASGFVGDSVGNGQSVFELTFSVPDWTDAQLGYEEPVFGHAWWAFEHENGDPVAQDCRISCLGEDGRMNYTLEAGTYVIRVNSDGAYDFGTSAYFSFDARPAYGALLPALSPGATMALVIATGGAGLRAARRPGRRARTTGAE